MKVSIDAKGVTELFRKAPAIFEKEIQKGVKEALVLVQRKARKDHAFQSQSNTLERSISVETNTGSLGGKVFLDTGIAIYGPYQHEGTGIYGPKRRAIRPKSAKALRFNIGGKTIFSKFSMGIQPDKFLVRAFNNNKTEITRLIGKAVGRAIAKAGLK